MKIITLSSCLLLSADFVVKPERKLCSYERIDKNAIRKPKIERVIKVVKFRLIFNVNYQMDITYNKDIGMKYFAKFSQYAAQCKYTCEIE